MAIVDNSEKLMMRTAQNRANRNYATFCDKVMGLTFNEDRTVDEVSYKRSTVFIRWAAFIVLVTGLISVGMQLFLYEGRLFTSTLYVSAMGALALASLVMVIYSFAVKRYGTLSMRMLFIFFFAAVLYGVSSMAILRDSQFMTLGLDRSVAGITIFACFLYLLAFVPLSPAIDNAIVGILAIAAYVVPLFLFGSGAYNLLAYAFVYGSALVIYIINRNAGRANSEMRLSTAMLNKQLTIASISDSLTNTFNRRSLTLYWAYLCSHEAENQVGVLKFDVDYLKRYNDYYTHTEGDLLLKKLCAAIINELGATKYLFRYGGEEFIVLIPNANEEILEYQAKSIRSAVSNAKLMREDSGKNKPVTITIGGAIEPIGRNANTDFVFRADEQLRLGKENGRNCIVINDEIIR